MSKATTIANEVASATIVDVLRLRAETQRDEIAYRFLADGEEERSTLTYGELYSRARQVAAELQKQSAVGQRALLLDSSEADYIVTFFGCLCAGVIAVPIYAPRLNKKGNARVESVVADAQPSVVLTAGAGSPAVRDVITASAGEHVKWIDINALPVDGDELWTPPAVRGTDIAFLQYTSGSTAAPKGVMVSHANILDNERMIQNAFDTKPGSVIVGWLPLFHDMGLIGNVLQPLYAGVSCILMSPVAFLQRPLRWLQAISRYQATTSGGPNFAYELCLRKIRAEDRSGLDLSSWRVAFNGAEPVRLETLNRFAAQFADCGFRREAFVPCYGLAEATLFVSGGLDPNGVTTVNHGANGNSNNGGSGNGAKISQKQGKLLVACGRPPVEQAVRIVSPDSLRQCSAGDVGEIWISGPSVAQGYWRKAKETEETFNARIPGIDEGPFLRTGDLGFLKDGHLFITGRLKDLLIIRGQNYYPQDIELTVEQSHPVLQPGSGAAFSVEIEGEERLVVVQEVAVRKDPESIVQSDLDELDALIKLISRNIVAGHELQAFAIVLIRKGTIPKTSSGKIQRHACRDAFLNRELYVVREWQERKQLEPVLPKPSHPELDGHGPYGLASWVAQEISRTQGIDQERVDLNQPFAAYGLDSLAAIEFAHKLQAEFQVEVDVAEFFGDSTITEVIRRATKNTQSPVRKVEKEQPATYPLSYGQRALWFVHQTAPESAAYNIARVIRIVASLDVGALRLAFQALVNRHPCLRTTVVETAGEPVQQVAEKVEVGFEYFDAGDWSQVELEKALVQQSQRPFSLTLGPLFRTALYARSEKEYLLHVAVHHLVADYWSLTLLLDEIGKLYQAFANKAGTHLVPLEYSYANFVEWQREKLSGPDGERLRDYWKSELAGELPPLSLPADHIRPPVQTFRGASLPFSLDARLTKALKRLGEEQQATLFTTLLAAFQVLLYRLTSQKQVIVGCPIAGRSRAEFANIAGYFVNAVPLRADFQHRQTFTEFLSQVRNRVSKAFAHELYPFSLMVEQLGIVRDPAVPPVFQSAFVFQQTYGSRSEDFVRFALGQPQAQVTLGGLQLEHVALEQRTAQFDLTLTVGEGPDGIVGAWEYSSDLFEKATIARWAECFSILLEEIISHPDISVSQLPILSGSQYDQLVEELNRTKLEYDSGQCLHELIEEQAKTKPASTAIVYRETELSYTELNERANQVARYLLRSGVRKEDLVGVCMRRSPEMVVAMLGIWKANAAYVPLDPQYPEERLRFMLEDADAKAVITEESLKERVGGTSATVLSWDDAREQIDKESNENVSRPACSLQLAYLIYTSGSSGVPKGVMLTHRNAVSFVAWARQTFTEEEFSGVLAATSICFDLSIYELWATLSCGGTVVLADDVISWWESLQGGRVTNRARLLNTVPSAVAQFIEQGPLPEGVVTINLAGEALKEELVSELWQRGNLKRVNNLYGPTETTTYSSWTPVEAEKKVTIGRGVGNTRLYALDQELELAPLGVVGELYIAGAGVGRGYWGRASLTAERFLPDPYSETAGDRMYRTGDLVRWNNAGQMEYLGRADQQVKVRGYRIELGEIEASVSLYPAVRENVVVVRESGRDRLLVAYTAPRAGMEINEEQLREYLQERLPRYMLPSKFVILESLPKTPNGKVDRKALPEPQQGEVKSRKPRSETEEMVAAIWAQVMQLDQVGMEENFFGLGGHSLLAMQVMSRIRQVFAVELQLRSFLENPTVAALALLVDKAARTAMPPLLPLPRIQPLRLSFAQERLWFLARYETEASLYNVPVALRLRGELNIEAAKASLQELVNRHEVLRTSFPEVGDSTIQDIAAEMEVPFAAVEIREDELDQVLREQARRPFDLSHGPLIRASLFRIGSQDHVLLVVMHHIVSDGWSLGVMLREFNALYDAFSRGAASPLQPLAIQYADYSEWQREWLQGEVLERQLDYWRKQLAGHETLSLPTDRPYSAKPTLAGAMETSRLPQPLLSKLKLFSDQQGVTLFMTLLAGFEILLYRYTGQTDISIGSAIANRSRQELEPLIGFFINTLVLRTQFTEGCSVAELLQRVRDVSLQAYAHQDIPFERLVEALDPARELSRTPFFQALFVLQNAPLPTVSWDGLETTASIVETGTAKFDLTLSAREQDGELELSLEYRTELFNAERMKRLLQHYRTLLEGIAVSVETRISELEMLSESERQQLLVEWNRTESPDSSNKCVHQLFEEQAAKTPQAVAVIDEDGQVSYEELNRRANRLAHYLARMGVGPEVGVGICMEHGLETMVGALGVLKAGGACVPLDPADPGARRSYMIKDAGAKIVLTHERFIQQIAGCAEHVVDLEEAREEIGRQSGDNLKVHLDAEHLAWVIYTSSSTGRPKGTAIPHCSAVSLLQRALIDATDQNPSVERLLNLCAPTEDTTYSTYAEVRDDGTGLVTIGRPLSNTQAYILDGHMKLVPVGVKGELYLGGAGHARGYLNRPELTAEKFVPNPFSQTSGERLYRTGDLVRYRENGNLEFLGRLDSQVKIQGYRIEPGEIEAAVLDYPGVTQAAVITRGDKPGNVRLVGYVASSEKLDVDRLRNHLQQRVPEYMVPAALLQLDTLPLTTNGKVDRKALLELESKEAMEDAGSLPLTPTEELIAGVWSNLLEKSEIRRGDNFFALGGHSLTSIQMLARVEQVFNREIELRAIFEFPVLKDFSAYVDQLTGPAPLATLRPIVPTSRDGRLPLSFAQQRLWFLSRYEAEASLYNVPIAVRLRGELNIEAAKASLQELVNRHEVLRTSFPEVGDSTIQDIAAEMEVPFAAVEIREDELDQVLREQARRPFDLSHGPLIRASLFRIRSQDHVLLVVMHHIVSDGWSLGVMLREFNVLYDSFSRGVASPLPPLPIQYADYSEWQREWLQGEVLERQLDYWRKQLAGHETLSLPTDRPYSAKPTLAGAMETSRLPEPLVSKLKLLSDQQGVTLFMTLLTGFEILLYRYTGQTDISVGSGIANRSRQELESLIGFFVNTLVLRTQFTEDSSVAELLQRVRDVSLQAYAHQDMPFERLVEALDPVRELGRTPFFQVLFALQNVPLPTVSWDGLEATASIVETGTAKFDLTLSAREEDGELELSLEYRTELFNAERMKRLLQHYRTLLEGMVVSLDARISELELLSEPERQQLLVEWNRTESPDSSNKCVHQLFEEQAAKTPQAVAVIDEDGQISYEELNRRANQLAHHLTKLGIGPEVRVAVCMERGLEMLVGNLGVLKAGGACVPLDPADPGVRRSYMAKDAGAKIVLTHERFIQQMAGCAEHVVDLKEAREEIERQRGDNLNVNPDAENLAWVIYTSSSTGRPKGTAIPHRSAVSVMQRALIDAKDQNPSVERLLNLCAPTEDTTYSTYAEVRDDGTGLVTIGRPLSNTQAYILDGHMKLVPVGIKGELYISGAGHARGYLNRPELTAEKFVPNPFSKDSGERLYRTGDLVRYQENGNLEFLGRLDSQVKIQGYRIEPGEIEAAVLDYPGVTQAAVIARGDKPGNVRLVGYVASSERLDVDRLRSHLQQRIPEYMVPAALLQLDTLPLTANGKVDRKALLELESKEAMEDAGSLPLTPTEELIAGVWSSLLGKSEIRRGDNFFDLGGHSLTSIQMLARVEQVFNREIESPAIFEFPVLKDFSAYVDQLTGLAPLATLRPIVPASRDGRLPLSFAQQRLWFLGQMEGASAAYHIPFGLHLKGDLNRTALRRALDRILARHEALRTTFAFLDGEPVQEIGAVEESSFRLLEHDLRGHNDVEAELAALRELEARAPFDLEAGPLIRGRLIRLAEDEHVLLITMHHIVSDGWSLGVLVRELNALYRAYGRGGADPLPELEIQYADYAVWQRQWIEGEILQQQAAYWKTTLAGAPALLELPTDRTRPVQQDFAGDFVELVLDEQLTSGLKDLSRRHGTTLYMTLLTGWAILLARLSGQQDVVIGSPVANRGRAEIENLIGFFVNTLALRLDLSGSPSVSELLGQTKAQSLAAQQHQDIPFEQVVELAQPVRSLAHTPLFQVMFAWQNATEARLELPGLEVQLLPSSSHRVAKFDLTLSLQEAGERIVGALGYATALYERSTVERYREYFLRLVEAMVADDTQVVDHLRLLTETERHQVLYEWNATERDYPRDKCVHELFEEQVRRSPAARAVVFEEEELSYEELNARANRLAHYLRELGVKPDERVAICVERGFEMIVGLLAVLKAGGGYVPLDPAYPTERLQYVLEDSAPVVLLTQRHLEERFSGIGDGVPVLDLNATAAWRSFPESNPDAHAVGLISSHLAYVIYTSGSTGQPKGVMVEHRGLCNISLTQSHELKVEPSSRILQFASFSFDACVWETLMSLCQGAALYLLPQERLVAGDSLIETVERDGITHATLPPTLLAGVSERANVAALPVLVAGGEALPGWLAERWGRGRQLFNAYGPTETTIVVTMHRCMAEESGNPPIGRPITNTRVYILDSNREPVPAGVVGEMYVGGAGVARGYLKRPELTAERFVQEPFVNEPGARMYRTGDLARWLPNGNIEFLGRNDHQVKIRGFRIELGEIEARLAEHPEVREAVVLAREDTVGERRLVAYYTASGTGEAEAASVGAEQLRAHLSAVVPDYMVPAAYVRMERLPLMPNGKVDRKALPLPEQEAYAVREYEAPVGEVETKLASVWAEVLKLEKVGRRDNFFELGGHSLLAVRVVSLLQRMLSVEVTVRDLFAHAELADLARHLQDAAHAELSRIMPATRSGRLPLSFAQQRLWFLGQIEGAGAAYHIPFGLHLKGDLNRTALGRALDRILVRHEVLRTTFALLDGEPVQEIGAVEESSFRLIEHDLCGHNDVEAELAALSELEAGASFDLQAGPLIRGRLIRLAEDEHVLLITMHHIVSDGWSLGVLVRELNALYGAFLGGGADPLPELEIQYADYAVWQRQWIEGEILQQQAAYWKTTLAGAPALLALPMDRVRPAEQSYAGAALPVVLEEKLTSGLKGLSRRNGTTLYMTLLTGWAILLARLSGRQDVVIGSPVANRGRAEIENLIGFFVNTLALRLDLSGSPSVSELLLQTKAQSLAAQRHQDIPFEQVVELAQPVRSLAHTPLFQVVFAWQNATEARVGLPGLEVQPLPSSSHRVAKFDLTLVLQEAGERIVGELGYATALYERSTVERYREYFLRLVEAMVADDTQVVDHLRLLTETERHQVLYEWNDTERDYPRDKGIHELFEEQVRRSPAARALVFEEEELSYGELNARANRLAHYLRELGVKPDERVAICVERGFEMIVGLLAVLKAGGGYVPLDTAYPKERLQYMLEDSAPVVLLTQRHLEDRFAGIGDGVPVLDLNADAAWQSFPESNPEADAGGLIAGHLAYVIYTSGSTGQPKGVMVEHRGLCNISLTQGRQLQVEPGSRILQFASFSFDACAWETLMSLCQGATLCLLPQESVVAGDQLIEKAARDGITHATLPPTLLAGVSEGVNADSLRVLMTGGEALPAWVAERWSRERRLINVYGPTETTIIVTTHRCMAEERGTPPIGRPITNTRMYILDSSREPVPVGIVGEIYAGGAGVARGYLRRPELTAERFVPDPFVNEPGARMYRTGDLARWLPDGIIEFLGRNDNQVKIRGFRIELGEIEARLTEHPEVRDAVVLAREDTAGEKRLVAYYIASGIGEVGAEQLRAHLSAVVPDYMVPAAYVRMERLPLTPNGKLDRKALPAPEQEAYAARGYEAPEGETETKLAEVWAEILHLEKVGRRDNFFELGGHSLLAVRVVSRLQRVLSVEVAVRDLFAHAELADLARHLQDAAHAELSRIMPATRNGRLPLSFAQQRLWFLGQMEGASAAYHIPFGLHLKGDLNRAALRRALDRILVRHEVLRTTFALLDGEPVQEIGAVEESSFRLIEHDLCGHNDVEAELAALSELEARASFDLQAGPLIRGRLIRLAEDEHVLLITMHHIVSDGWSMGVLVRELNALYGAFLGGEADPLPELEIQYADYAVWQRQWIEGEILQQQAAYWKTTLAGAPALLGLPTDHPRPVRQDFVGGFVELALDEQLTAGLKELGRRNGTTLYMTLLAGWVILLARLSGRQDVVIGSPVANRGRAEIENLIGFFVNTLALRLDLSGSPSISELLLQTKAQSLAAQRHQDIPFEQVVELAQPVRSLAHTPLFQVMFAWQNATESLLELPGLKLQPFVPPSHKVAKFDMTLSLRATGDTIAGGIEYASALFEAATIHRYIGYFLALLKAMVADDAQPIDRLPMLSGEEREQVLYEWNETKAEFPSGKCVHELFEEQVRRSPQATAVAWEEKQLNYGELNARANGLAHYLRELGVGPETRIGLMVERSIEMVVGLLGVLKAGAAYVPLDSGSARERLKHMLEDSGARLVLTSRSLLPAIREVAGPEVLLVEAEEWRRYSSEGPQVHKESAQLAYVIYTSGSTGRPKGVGVEHRQLVNYVRAIGEKLQIVPGARLGLVSTYAADLGYTMIFPALCYGGCLDVVDADRVLDAGKLEEHFSRHPIDYLKIVPSHLRALLNSSEGNGLLPRRWLILGGEASSWDLIQQVKERGAGCRVLNHYGPTETTVGVLTYDTTSSDSTQDDGELQAGGMVPIGRPLSNERVYVLDSELNPVGVGVSGEICIGGAGVARGYLKREDLTAEKFLANPYSAEPGGRMYRTGDLGRYLKSGNIEFLGRKDHQVKIRGFRVELGEIEATLMEHPEVRESVVVAREDESGEKRLVAYVVPEGESEESNNESGRVGLQMSELREHLLGKLPEYMVPTAYVPLKKIPLTPNGKIDRRSLPEPDKDIREQEYVGPRNATEETLCRLWQEVLRRERVGIHDNFFDIGGHSLLAVQVTSRTRQAFTVEMPLSVLFAAPTVARMAEHIARVNGPDRSQSSPVLVNIQPHGSRPPVFCVHAVGGQVISYADLSHEMGLEQPFYGLQSPPANWFPASEVSIEQMAALYNREIRSVQPAGPYLLSGWSMGGLVAWEMAQQLIQEGETIGLLALMDTAPPSGYLEADDRDDEMSLLARFAVHMSRLIGKNPQSLAQPFLLLTPQDQWKIVQETLTSYGVLTPKTAHAEMTALLDVFTRNFRAMNHYSIQPCQQAVVYLRASETPERFSRLWTKWSGGGIQVHSVPGDHFTFLRRPNVRIIAQILQRSIAMNGNNESRAVSPEMGAPGELINIESQHTR